MPTLANFPSPAVARETFAGGFSEGGKALLTLDELTAFDPGTGRGAERIFRCPFCGATERAFHVNAETGHFNCKRGSCKVKGLLREFWEDRPMMTGRAKASARLRKAFELPPLAPQVAEFADGDAVPDESNWRAQWENAFTLDDERAAPGVAYLKSRVLDVDAATQAGVRFTRNWAPSPTGKVYKGAAAILYPMRDIEGALQAVGGRYLRPMVYPETSERKAQTVKVRTGGDADRGAFWCPVKDCWGGWVTPSDIEHAVIVEGAADALALAYLGVPTIALGGTNPPEWLHRAAALKTTWIALDNDEGGDNGAGAVFEKVNGYARSAQRLTLKAGHWGEAANDFAEVIETRDMRALSDFLRVSAPGLQAECRRARLAR